MSCENALLTLFELIYEAALESSLWPQVLNDLADATGTAQAAMPSFDWRATAFAAIAPRIDPDLVAEYRDYWAFREPIVPRAALRPLGEIYALDSLMEREEFQATAVFNEWWRPAGCGLAAMGANLAAEDRFSALICLFNAPGKDSLSDGQARLFKTALPHIMRAIRISRQVRFLELEHAASPERLEDLPQGALLTDASARPIFANKAAKGLLDAGKDIALRGGRLCAVAMPDRLQKMIASCAQTSLAHVGPGGELKVPRQPPQSPLIASVAPVQAMVRRAAVPWIRFGAPAALVLVADPDMDRRQREASLRGRFELTFAEARLATEILKGHGRKAAAQCCGISDATARTQLTNIFEKTGTRRQAELVRLLLDAADVHKPG